MNTSDIEKVIGLYGNERTLAERCRESADEQKKLNMVRIYRATAADHDIRAAAIEQVLNVLGYRVDKFDDGSYKIVKER